MLLLWTSPTRPTSAYPSPNFTKESTRCSTRIQTKTWHKPDFPRDTSSQHLGLFSVKFARVKLTEVLKLLLTCWLWPCGTWFQGSGSIYSKTWELWTACSRSAEQSVLDSLSSQVSSQEFIGAVRCYLRSGHGWTTLRLMRKRPLKWRVGSNPNFKRPFLQRELWNLDLHFALICARFASRMTCLINAFSKLRTSLNSIKLRFIQAKCLDFQQLHVEFFTRTAMNLWNMFPLKTSLSKSQDRSPWSMSPRAMEALATALHATPTPSLASSSTPPSTPSLVQTPPMPPPMPPPVPRPEDHMVSW